MINREQWQQFILQPTWLRYSLITGGLLGVMIFIAIHQVLPLRQSLLRLQQAKEDSQKALLAMHNIIANQPSQQNLLSQQQRYLSQLKQHQSLGDEPFDLTTALSQKILLSGCQLQKIQAFPRNNLKSLVIFRWQITLSANYFQLLNLLGQLSQPPEIYLIEKLDIKTETSQLNIQLELQRYQIGEGML